MFCIISVLYHQIGCRAPLSYDLCLEAVMEYRNGCCSLFNFVVTFVSGFEISKADIVIFNFLL